MQLSELEKSVHKDVMAQLCVKWKSQPEVVFDWLHFAGEYCGNHELQAEIRMLLEILSYDR